MLLDGLDDDQRAVALATAGPVVVYAGAGAGKTRAITHRIAHAVATGEHDPRRSLAVTFTTKAAGELRARLAQLGAPHVAASTFHAAALRQLRHFWSDAVGGEPWAIQASKAKLMAEAAYSVGVQTSSSLLRDLAAEVEWAKVQQLEPATYAAAALGAGRDLPMDANDVTAAWNAYEDIKRQRAVIDFEDVLLLTVGMLADRPDIAEQIRQRYRWFTVDEFQDVNPLQHRLLELWLGDRDDICVVGDPAQTIYTFAGADPSFLENFTDRWSNATVVRLARTYRCSPQIAAVANQVLAGSRQALRLQSQQPDGALPRVLDFDDEIAESAGIAAQILQWKESGVALRDIAVLYRTNAQSEPIEHALSDVGIAYTVRGAERFFDRAEIRRAITLVRGQAIALPTAPVIETVREILTGLGWNERHEPGGAATREVWEAYSAFLTLAQDVVAATTSATLSDLVRELDARLDQQHAPSMEGVTLASLHAAKGLEWKYVVLAGCAEGLLPLAYADGETAIAEERRLFYVGVTRAAEVLICTWARARTAGARASRQPSRFLAAIDDPLHASAATRSSIRRGAARGERVRTGPAKCRVCRTALTTGVERTLGRCTDCPADFDEALYERLVLWRLTESRERSVPAYVVFTDATLRAVAEVKPSTSQELSRISGIGAQKLALYGDVLLALVAG